VLDVDGVLTDGSLVYGPAGEIGKRFHVRDGLGLRMLTGCDVAVAVISGRRSAATIERMRELGVPSDLVIQGSKDKLRDLERVRQSLDLRVEQMAAMGDDLPDIPILAAVGFAACPGDAAPEVAAVCHHVCGVDGGAGAVREFAELILKARGQWAEVVAPWTAAFRAPADDES